VEIISKLIIQPTEEEDMREHCEVNVALMEMRNMKGLVYLNAKNDQIQSLMLSGL